LQGLTQTKKAIRYVRSAIEDHCPTLTNRSSRKSDKVGRRERIRLNTSKTRWFCPSESKPTRFPASLSSSRNPARSTSKRFFPAFSLILMNTLRSSAVAEKDGKGMASKLLTQAEGRPDGIDSLEGQATKNGREVNYFVKRKEGAFIRISST
jgi:hypothetical protein